MPWAKVKPILLEYEPRYLCERRYAGHPRGCPNYGDRPSCPPSAEIWTPDSFDNHITFVVWNVFQFGAHVAEMRKKHPGWSERQCACCLYWQGGARKRLGKILDQFRQWSWKSHAPETPLIYTCPEAHGVNVTATMKRIGIKLEWPPKQYALQIALAVIEKGDHDGSQ